ncbi:uncharacterized protein [Amphiura filiformis]|uniref:uncharacterized protein n=1 Tax=Amphiura filiformis TaxID=82378 RepID=UPI003B221D5F
MILSVVFLAIAIISSLGYTQSQQNQPENNCNTCCQGPGGIPGIPGTAGHNGLAGHGRDGMKGDRGESGMNIKGDKGETGFGQVGLPGPQGLRGEKGDLGVGLPGKTGPRGLLGPVGIQGIPGGPGAVGQKGQKGDNGQSRKSAFTAVKTSTQTGNANDVLEFDTTSVNINEHFSLATNKFTCVFPGTYVFMYSILIYHPTEVHINLVKNGNLVVTAHTRTGGFSNDADAASNSAILNLQSGDQVWLKFQYGGRQVLGNRYSSFSGFLLYEI